MSPPTPRWVERISHTMRDTYGPRVIARHNAFAGLFRLDFNEQLFRRNYRNPVLVACTRRGGQQSFARGISR
jgi:phosphoribosylformylglycinamidine cyclo-ligase